jgi:hypothetical protein
VFEKKNKSKRDKIKELKEDKNNRVCHYCGEIIFNALSDASECYVDANGNWYCSYEKCYQEYHEVKSFF